MFDIVMNRLLTDDVVRINVIRWIVPHLEGESNVEPNDIMGS